MKNQGHFSEEAVIRLFRGLGGAARRTIVVGPGDDAAVLRPPRGKRLLLTTDLLAEGIHFRRSWARPEDLGWKLAAVNVSDIAAMGGHPLWALLSLALPRNIEFSFIRRFRRGLNAAARRFGFVLVGGDTCASGGEIFLSLTLAGTVGGRFLTRDRALPGDLLFVTGNLGASTLGLAALEASKGGAQSGPIERAIRRHLRPQPPATFGPALAETHLATTAIDISDGLSRDLSRLCAASRVGAEILADKLPILPSTIAAARNLGHDQHSAALHGGEEYELLFSAPKRNTARIATLGRRMGIRVNIIGRIAPQRHGITVTTGELQREPLVPRSWEHFSCR